MSPSNLEIMHPKGTNGFASSVIDKCENRPVDLQSLNLASNYVKMQEIR